MEWELKQEMANLADKKNESEDDRKKFHNFVINNIKNFDLQAWSIFIELIDIIPEEMERDFEFWKMIHKYIKKSEDTISKLDLRALIRIAYIETVCEDKLNMESNE